MSIKYDVHFTAIAVTHLEVEADSYEDAVRIACECKPQVIVREVTPDWVATADALEKNEEYEYEVIGRCASCQQPIVERELPDQPWTYTADDNGDMVCFPCRPKGSR